MPKSRRFLLRFFVCLAGLLLSGVTTNLRAATTNVSIRDFFYTPTNVVITAGDTVNWVNNGANAHDTVEGLVTQPAGVPRLFDSPTFSSGGSFPWIFTNVGFHRYFCSPHIGMFPQQTGTVTVLPPLPAQIGASIMSPANGARFTNAFTVSIVGNGAARDSKLARIEFFAGSLFVGSDTNYPFTALATNLPVGTNFLTAVAVDVDGLRGTSAPVAIALFSIPSNLVVRIQSSAFIPQTITIGAGSSLVWSNVDALTHTVSSTNSLEPLCGPNVLLTGSVRCTNIFMTPGVYPYYCTIHPTMRGTVIVAQAASAPLVALTRPANGAVLATNGPITFEASASDPDGIGRVQFFRAPNTLLAQIASPPFTVFATGMPTGTHTFFARAIDGQGFGNISAPLSATLLNAAPLQLLNQTNVTNSLQFNLTTTPGLTYITERAGSLPAAFAPFRTNLAVSNTVRITDPIPPGTPTQKFYRAFIQQ